MENLDTKVHVLRRRKIDSSAEQTIITAMIVSTAVCSKLSEITRQDYFTQPHISIISQWVLDYFKQYGKAPFQHIQDIYHSEKSTLKEEDSELVGDLLSILSKRFENGDYTEDNDEINVQYVVDRATKYYRQRDLEIHIEKMQGLIRIGMIKGAEELHQKYDYNKFNPQTVIELPTFTDILNLDIKLEWIWENFIPKQAVTVIHGTGGIGKTWLGHQLGIAISNKESFFLGYAIQNVPVYYIDFENPLPAYLRAKFLGESEMKIWHSSYDPTPPKMDTDLWINYKSLIPGLIIFDTLRSCQNLDENSSKDMSLIMNRFKELRDIGFTVVVLHHTPKADRGTYKGSTAIQDLCDHLLSMDSVTDNIIKLGVPEGGKTRYLPYSIYMRLEKGQGLVVSESDSDFLFKKIETILDSFETLPNQSEFSKAIMDNLGLGKNDALKKIKNGIGKYWIEKTGEHNKKVYQRVGARLIYRKKQDTDTVDEDA